MSVLPDIHPAFRLQNPAAGAGHARVNSEANMHCDNNKVNGKNNFMKPINYPFYRYIEKSIFSFIPNFVLTYQIT
jgi:hypothetical protein